jgi:hypothetical protein
MDDIMPGKWYAGKTGEPRGVFDLQKRLWLASTLIGYLHPGDLARGEAHWCQLDTFARWARRIVPPPSADGCPGWTPKEDDDG